MRVKTATLENFNVLTKALNTNDTRLLTQLIDKIGLEGLMDRDLLHLARGSRQPSVVMFITTLAIENMAQSERAYLILHAYRSIMGKALAEEIAPLGHDHIVIQAVNAIIHEHAEINPPGIITETDLANWFDAIELAVDFGRLPLAEVLTAGFINNKPEDTAIVSLKYRLSERQALLPPETDWNAMARCHELVLHAIDRKTYEELWDHVNLHAVECYAKAENWDRVAVLAKHSEYNSEKHVAFHRLAEAYCQQGDYFASIREMDRFIETICEQIDLSADETPVAKVDAASVENTSTKDVFNPEHAGKALAELQEILEPTGKAIFLVSGTLLGYARTGSVLSHDKDMDVGLFGWEEQFEIVQRILDSGKFKIFFEYIRGNRTYQLPVVHYETGTTIDMFFYRKENNKFVTGINAPWNYLQRFEFSPFVLRETKFLGTSVWVPHNIDQNLTENFGNWRIPEPDYVSHVESPSMIGAGELVHMLVCRLNLVSAITEQKYSRISRILAVLDHYSDRPGRMENHLREMLESYAKFVDKKFSRRSAS
jgi:hypothetical protein